MVGERDWVAFWETIRVLRDMWCVADIFCLQVMEYHRKLLVERDVEKRNGAPGG